MLERAARCLDYGARPACRSTSRVLHSRRQLHCDFWNHGAGNLDLPLHHLSGHNNLFEPPRQGLTGSTGSSAPDTRQDAISDSPLFLGFLYPPETRAFIKRMNAQHTRRLHQSRPQKYKSRPSRPSDPSENQDGTEDVAETSLAQGENDAEGPQDADDNLVEDIDTLTESVQEPPSNISRRLVRLLETVSANPTAEMANDIWDSYDLLPLDAKTTRIKQVIVNRMSRSPRQSDASRVIQAFETIPAKERTLPAVSGAVLALTTLGSLKYAARIHDAALNHSADEKIPFSITGNLLSECLSRHDWDTLLEVFKQWRNRHITTSSDLVQYDSFIEQWTVRLQKRNDHAENILALLSMLSKYPALCNMDHVRELASRLADFFFELADERTVTSNRAMISLLNDTSLASRELLEKACLVPLKLDKPVAGQVQAACEAYWAYRQSKDFHPSRSLLQRLVSKASSGDFGEYIDLIEADWRRAHGPVTAEFGLSLMHWHSRRTDHARVFKILQEILKNDKVAHIDLFIPIIRAEALRLGPKAAEQRLENIKADYGISPNLRCYNLLLHAYARAEDFQGMLEALSRMISAGVSPDTYSIGTVLGLCARRGDTDTAKTYLRLAVQKEIPLSMPIYESLVMAYINDYNYAKAFQLARKVSRQDRENSTRIWTQLISSLAKRKRFRRALRASYGMRKLGVPLDSNFFAALMRVFSVSRRPQQAAQIMTEVMPKQGIEPTAINYAVLMEAYTNAGRFDLGMQTYADMLEKQIRPILSVRLSLLKLQARAAQQQMHDKSGVSVALRADVVEELLEEYLQDSPPAIAKSRSSELTLVPNNIAEDPTSAYVNVVLDLYGRTKAYEAVKLICTKFEKKLSASGADRGLDVSLEMLFTALRVRYEQDDFDGVQHYWNLCVKTAKNKKALFNPTQSSSDLKLPVSAESTDELGLSIGEANSSKGVKKMSQSSRHALARHLDIYMRGLFRQRRYSALVDTIGVLGDYGFELDSRNWNLYIQLLCIHKFYHEAFVLAERRLMQHFRGFDVLRPQLDDVGTRGQESRVGRSWKNPRTEIASGVREIGMEYIGPANQWLSEARAHILYRSLVRLRRVLVNLNDESVGAVIPVAQSNLVRRERREMLDKIERDAPKVVQAVRDMPNASEGYAAAVIGKSATAEIQQRKAARGAVLEKASQGKELDEDEIALARSWNLTMSNHAQRKPLPSGQAPKLVEGPGRSRIEAGQEETQLEFEKQLAEIVEKNDEDASEEEY